MAVYAVSDLHGNGKIWSQIKKILTPADRCIILGDLIDRGPNGYAMAKEALDDPRFIYLKGNHEKMFIDAAEDYPEWTPNMDLYFNNGGMSTWEKYEFDPNGLDFFKKMNSLPLRMNYTSNDTGYTFLLSHAGWDLNQGIIPDIDKYFTWNRTHLKVKTLEAIPESFIMVHGHTPVQTMEEWDGDLGAVFYDDGLKINLDVDTINTGYAILFNLDSFDEILVHETGVVK